MLERSEEETAEEPRAASYYDGQTALRHRVQVALVHGGLRFVESGEEVPVAELRPLGDRRSAVFGHRTREGWRLVFDEPLPARWIGALPRQEHHGGILDRIGVIPALVGGAALAMALLYVLVQGTNLVAQIIPERWETPLGEAMVNGFGGGTCRQPDGQAALDRLAQRLSIDGRPTTVQVVDVGMVNAAALPGRQVVIFRGLVDNARSPDEVAGILGHELGHVEHRHVMAALLRTFGLSLILGGADGGAIAQGLLANRYSRDAERDADDYAIAALRRAGISPRDTAGFFARLAAGAGKAHGSTVMALVNLTTTHPSDSSRQARFEAAAKGMQAAPALSPAEWKALKEICRGGAKVNHEKSGAKK